MHKDLRDETGIPGFVRRLQAQSPLGEISQSPAHAAQHGSRPGPVPRQNPHGLRRLERG